MAKEWIFNRLWADEFEALNFERVCDLGDGLAWFEIQTQAQADAVARAAGGLATDVVFEEERRDNEGHPSPHRWFAIMLRDDEFVLGLVVVAVPGPGLNRAGATLHVSPWSTTGFLHRKPYPRWANEIVTLSEVIGMPIPPNRRGRLLGDFEARTPGWPNSVTVMRVGPQRLP